jgi:hypothetical protein
MKVQIMAAALAVGMLSVVSQAAMAKDKCYFAVLSNPTPILQNSNRSIEAGRTVPLLVETTTSAPVVIERTNTMSIVIDGTRTAPLLEKTSAAKPHRLPFSFGVWP